VSLALYLTSVRIVISPIFVITYLYHDEIGITLKLLPYLLIALLGISEISDLLDGFVARRTNQVTDLGKLLDPMADSIFRLSVFLAFTQGFIQLPLILVLLFLYRDSTISTLRILCALRGLTLAARLSGKIKAVIQAVSALTILLLMIPYSLGLLELKTLKLISVFIVGTAAIYTLYSGIEYIYSNRNFIKKALRKTA